MKKVMYVLMVAVMPFISCSSDDDTPQEPVIDPIVGKWYQIQETQIVNGVEKTSPMTACEKMDNFDIKNDGTIISTFYYDDENNECQVDGSEKINWVITAEGAYTFTYIEDDNYTTEVKLEGETLTEIYSYTSGDYKVQDINVYSMTADTSGDDEGIAQQDQIVGKWRESKSTTKSYQDGKLTENETTVATENDYNEIEFKSDGTFTEFFSESYTSGGEVKVETSTDGGTYEVKGDKIIITYPPDENGEDGGLYEAQYSLSGSTLTTFSIDEEMYNNINYKEEVTIEWIRL